MLQVNDMAPSFCLKDAENKQICLDNFTGKWLILYFYPRDNTSGCTKEAVGFSEKVDEIRKLGAEVLGISKDSVKSHQSFIKKHTLKIILLSDPEHEVIEKYGAWQLKKSYGREYYGTVRNTFLIDPNGKISHIWPKVKVKEHVEEVINRLKELKEGGKSG